MDNQTSQLDPQTVNLAKAIRQTESGGNFQAKGKSGEYGAYQYTEPTWQKDASAFGVNVSLKDATPEQQNEVVYKKIKSLKDQGYNVGQIASIWNSGKPDAYKDTDYKGINKQGVSYDVPAYAKSVATAYQTIKNGGQVGVDPNNPSSVAGPKFPFVSQGNVDSSDPNANLQADTSGSGTLNRPLALEQGLGYALSNAVGTQDQNIETQNKLQDTQGKLIQKIKEDKAQGKDTSRLEKALTDLTGEIVKGGNQISGIGTGGITNKQVLASAGEHAAVAGAAYGGGLLNELRGAKAINNPIVTKILEGSIGPDETIGSLSRDEAINALGNSLKEMSVSDSGGKEEQTILKALQELKPSLTEKEGLIKSLLKKGASLATQTILVNALGNKVGGLAHKILNI